MNNTTGLSTRITTLFVCVWLVSLLSHSIHADDRPNIILIMADDVGLECFPTYGPSQYNTPNIDAMAKRGIKFDNCHVSPLCTPTRVKLMTGKSNIRNYHDFSILLPTEKTFGHYFKEAGYETAVAGKWQLLGAEHYGAMAGKGSTPKQAGFDEYCLWQIEKLGPRYWNPKLDQNGKFLDTSAENYGPDLCTDFICEFVTKNKEKPFFVYYPMILGHNPFKPTPHSTDKNSTNKKQNFLDMVAYTDHLLGRIIKHVESEGLEKETLILFLTDNGTNRSITSKAGDQKIKGAKGRTIDHGTHSPLVALWPEKINAGSTCKDMVDLTDFMATFAELSNLKLPHSFENPKEKLDGISFAPQLLGKTNPHRRTAIYCYYHPRPTRRNFAGPIAFARNEKWKLYDDGKLFNVENDPLETQPIAEDPFNKEPQTNRKALKKVLESMPKVGLQINQSSQSPQ